MDALSRAALVGTERHPPPAATLEALGTALDPHSPERRLLLAAGARAVARSAGCATVPAPEAPEPAPPDVRPVCGAAAARLLAPLLRGRHADVLPEALARLDRAGMRLPPALLPAALGADPVLHDALRPVLGARGAWLAARHPDGGWVAAERVEAPLAEADLERRLDHRSASQRRRAIRELARRPDSRFAREMRARAESLLPASLRARLPDALDDAWRRDLGTDRPPEGLGEKAGWVIRTVGVVPPAYWEAVFGREPWRLVADLDADDAVLLEALTRATLLHGARPFAVPLFDAWQERVEAGRVHGSVALELRAALLRLMASADAEERVGPVLMVPDDALEALLEALPTPWSGRFSRFFLLALRGHLEALGPDSDGFALPWVRAVRIAGAALAPAVLDEALGPWPLPRSRSWRIRQWQSTLHSFGEVVRIRHDLVRAIPLTQPEDDP